MKYDLFPLFLLLSIDVLAQSESKGVHSQQHENETNAFVKRGMNQMPIPYKEYDSNPALKGFSREFFFGRNSEQTLASTINIFRDPYGTKTNDELEAGDRNELGELQPDEIKHKTYTVPSIEIRKSLMHKNSDAIVEGWNKELDGDTTQYAIAIAQVEPGIAQGMLLANSTVDSYESNNFRALNAFRNHPFENMQVKQKMDRIFDECVFQKISNQNNKISMFAAIAQCLGDTGTKEKASTITKAEDTNAKTKPLKNEQHPIYKNDSGAVVKGKISVAAELFNYGTDQKKKRSSLYESWIMIFGDYEMMIDEKNDKSKDFNTYTWVEKRIPPQKRIGEIINLLVNDRYTDFMQLCQRYSHYMANELENKSGEKSFWVKDNFKGGDNPNRAFRLSTPEKALNASTIEIMVRIVLTNLRTKNFKEAEEFFKANDELSKVDFDVLSKHANRDVILFARSYAHYVAMSQMLRAIQEALKFVGSRTAGTGSIDATITNRALQLINDVVDTNQINNTLIQNAIAWDKFERENIQLAVQKIVTNAGLKVQSRNKD